MTPEWLNDDGASDEMPESPAAAEPVDEADEAVAEAEAVLTDDLAALAQERDEFRALAQQIQADFENYRKRVLKQQTDHLDRAGQELIEKLLPVLDACEAAVAHGAADVEPVYSALLNVLEREGLKRFDATGERFDPNLHEAVAQVEGEDDAPPTVAEVMRTGYLFKGRVLRPAMVKVAG